MKLVEQILLGLVVIIAEITLIGAILLWRLRERWRALKDDPEDSENIKEPSTVLVIAILAMLLAGGILGLRGGYALMQSEREPSMNDVDQAAPTPTSSPPIIRGRVCRLGTQDGLAGVVVNLNCLSGDAWQEEVASDTSDSDGSFSITPPDESEAQGKYQLRVQLPSGWNHISKVYANGWEWSNTAPFVVEGSFSSSEIGEAVIFEAAIHRTFSGTIYFEGEESPKSATVQLHHLDAAGNWSLLATRQVERPSADSPQQITSAVFTLTHKSILEDDQYQVSIAPLQDAEERDWVTGSPDAGHALGSTVILTPGLETEIHGIVFAGPLPIRLSYETAIFDPPYDPENPGAWRDEFVPDEVTYPFATREDSTVPRGMRARWPVYLPGGNGNAYEIWVATPGLRSSAVVSYSLHTDIDGQPGLQIPGEIEEVVQCRNDETYDEWMRAATYWPADVPTGGVFWVVVDESRARWPERCLTPVGTSYLFRMPVWMAEIQRGQ